MKGETTLQRIARQIREDGRYYNAQLATTPRPAPAYRPSVKQLAMNADTLRAAMQRGGERA